MTTIIANDSFYKTYNDVFDARTRFRAKSAMERVPLGCILPGDIVLLECALVRTEEAEGLRKASFVLDALHCLIEKPRAVVSAAERRVSFPAIISVE